MIKRTVIALTLLLTLVPASHAADTPDWVASSRFGMVAADSYEASQIGAAVLEAGGNAFDAAIATSFALAVARPESTGLGGGGFMVAFISAEKRCVALDFRETAPAAATLERYQQAAQEAGDGPSPTLYGGYAVGVPGQLAGLDEIRRRYGTWPLDRLIEPAERLARKGLLVDRHYRACCADTFETFEKYPDFKDRFAPIYRHLLNNGELPEIGQRIPRTQLADAMKLIASDGPAAFYTGPIGQAIAQTVKSAGGPLTASDMATYRVVEREPVRGTWDEYEIFSMPPPSSGGICIIETLNILKHMRVRSDVYPPHGLVEAFKHAFSDRARYLGDPDFTSIPTAKLIDPDYAAQLARKINPRTLPDIQDYGTADGAPFDRGTSHFCVIDRDHNVVALTETVNGTFGSLLVAEPFGIVLNNEMDDFALRPGQPNLYGLVQGEANAVGPGKRPLSSMSPTIVLRDKAPVLALGGSGGPRIITSVFQVLQNVLVWGQPLSDAMSAVRLHHQWLPNEVYFDRDPPTKLAEALQRAGHELSEKHKTGVVQAIYVNDGVFQGACDPRKGGRPVGATKLPVGPRR